MTLQVQGRSDPGDRGAVGERPHGDGVPAGRPRGHHARPPHGVHRSRVPLQRHRRKSPPALAAPAEVPGGPVR